MVSRSGPTNHPNTPDCTGTWTFCAGNGIFVSPSLELRAIPGCGTGVYTTKPIAKGTKLMHVPTKALYTTASIPAGFADARARKRTPVHALLAAYLTFGFAETDHDRYAQWMSMWPELLDLTTSMPMFWPEECRLPYANSLGDRVKAAKSSLADEKKAFDILPPPTTGAWLPAAATDERPPRGCTSSADQQINKLQTHLDAVAKLLPHYASALRDPHDSTYWRFIQNWCCVNARCFYYVPPGHNHPADPNEAMAMCPGMDMFNHTGGVGCTTRYDRTGYSVVAEEGYEADEEVFLSYGAHTNDVLWAEYGFLLDENGVDAIRIDRLVLDNLDRKQKDLLAEYGYLGDYYVKKNGVCWRTEVVAWLTVLSEKEWVRMVQEGWDPADLDQATTQLKRKLGDTSVAVHRDVRVRKQKRGLVECLLNGKKEAEASLRGLAGMSIKELLNTFADDSVTLKAQGVLEADVERLSSKQATQRHTTCLKRWKQIWQIFMATLKSIEMECAGSLVMMEPGGMQHDWDMTLDTVRGPNSDRN